MGRNVCVDDCDVGFVSSAYFNRLCFSGIVLGGKEEFCIRTGVGVIDCFVYKGDESTATDVDPVLPDGGEIME